MKPSVKIGSLLLAVMMVLTALFAVGCTPISLNKEWSYKTSDKELAIGVYIYSLQLAYQQAQTYASEQVEDYSTDSDAWLDKEITDDNDKTQVAREWIKEEAKTMSLTYLVIEEQLTKEGVQIEESTIASADEQAKTNWEVGPYASYGMVAPMKDEVEKYGVSFESFAFCTSEFQIKYEKLFDAVYAEGGSKAVSDDELKTFFNENYVDYSYLPVNLYTASTDEAGQQKNVALSEEDAKKLTDEIDGYAKDIKDDQSFDDAVKAYMDTNKVTTDPSTDSIEQLEKVSAGDEIKNALKELDNNKATTVKVGSGDSAIYYLVYKRDIKKATDDYVANETNKASILGAMKGEEFADYIESLTKELKYEENTAVIDRYKPEMFFVKVEPTTTAEQEATAQ